ncbi:MAG TPA: MBL fold metallo-hydrolase [Pirellulales bacterium]|jgi:metallo-beta-lactamase family protein|nr:MBL fold metallo-hydrolase [Pirellulales bacterium]
MTRITFHGAAETVTGSKYLLEAEQGRVLIDCGLFQGLKPLRLKNWEPLPFAASSVQAIVLTHAHIDHVGYLPRFVHAGYRGPVYCTPPTAELAELVLYDCAKNAEEDADYANQQGFSKHKPALPLYDAGDVSQALKLLRPTAREAWFSPAAPIWTRYHDSGHLLGASMIEVEIRSGPKPLRILFSGDVGRYRPPLYHDPAPPPACDYLICESTYGDRDHPPGNTLDQLCDVVKAAIARGGVMLVAAFAIGRSQQLIYLLRELIEQKRIPELPIYLDSPMAVNSTTIYCKYAAEHEISMDDLSGPECALYGRNVHLVRTVDESKQINRVAGPAVIISSAGMMTGGRILHHLEQRAGDPRNTIMLGGYMAEGTRGRALQDGAKSLQVYGRQVPVRAAVAEIPALSGHADRSELLRWLTPLAAPRQTFLTHGEKTSATALAAQLTKTRGWNTLVPHLEQTIEMTNDE